MLRSKRSALASLVAIVGTAGLAALVVNAAACGGSSDSPSPEDSGTGGQDASHPTPSSDAGPDATVKDNQPDAAIDGEVPPVNGGPDAGDASNGGPDCAAIFARMLSAPIAPPNGWIGLDLSKGGGADGGVNGGGLTIDEADILACASSVEPDVLEAGATPYVPGGRTAFFMNDAGAQVSVTYNIDSRVIWQIQTSAPATSTLKFHARKGGPYAGGNADGGVSEYEIGFGPDGDAGAGYVKKNGVDLPADWSTSSDDAGAMHGSAWINEIYDGIMATYAPEVPAVADCLSTPMDRFDVPTRESVCLADSFVLGIRPLGAYILFNFGTNQATSAYTFWPGGWPTCSTPRSALDNLVNLPIAQQENPNTAIGPLWQGTSIGGIPAADPISNPNGLLYSEANLAGCGGHSITAPDPGYEAQEWGTGQVSIEYKADSGVAYKVFAGQGFLGGLGVTTPEDDGGYNNYGVQIGPLTLNGAPVTLDWSAGDAGTLNAAVTDLSNGWLADTCGIVDTDCVQAGDCTIVPDDGQNHSVITLQTGPAALGVGCLDFHPLTIVFPKGSSVPSQIYATNPGGQ